MKQLYRPALPGDVPFTIFEQHKRSLETLEFQKDGKPIEDADEIPQEAEELMEEYRETKQSELLYIKAFRIMSVFVLISLVICYIRNDKTEKQKKDWIP